jgi:hypothetical protein
MPGARTTLLASIAAAATSACAPVTAPIHFHLPGAAASPMSLAALEGRLQEDAVVGPLRVAARAGLAFIEIRIHNTGADEVLIDWSGSSFIAPPGRPHAMVTAEWLMDAQTSAMPLPEVMFRDPGSMVAIAALWGPGAPAAHMPPTALHMQQQPFQRIGPGAEHVAVLYPAEHVVAVGWHMHAGAPLLCDASPAATLPVALTLRWHGTTGWRVDQLAGTLPVGTARLVEAPRIP